MLMSTILRRKSKQNICKKSFPEDLFTAYDMNAEVLDPKLLLNTLDAQDKLIEVKQTVSVLWLVNGSVENAREEKGVCALVYRLADTNHGFYGQNRNSLKQEKMLWYKGRKLQIRIAFKKSMLYTLI